MRVRLTVEVSGAGDVLELVVGQPVRREAARGLPTESFS